MLIILTTLRNSWSKALGLHRSGGGWVGFSRGLDFKAVSFVLRAKSDHAALTPTCQPRGGEVAGLRMNVAFCECGKVF